MSTALYIAGFNKTLVNFIDELYKTFPENNNLLLLKTTIETVIKMNSLEPQRLFRKSLEMQINNTTIRQYILDNNPAFIFADDVSAIGASISDGFSIISQIKTCWTQLSDSGRARVMRYLLLLVQLSDKIQ